MDENWQRLKNGMIYKIWVTDKEMEEIMPIYGILVVVVAVIGGIVWFVWF